MGYKCCDVPKCKNTSIKTPGKVFISAPKNPKLRKIWLHLARRNNQDSLNSKVYFCEDHFDMEKMVENYMQFKMGFSQKVLMIRGALPSKFDCKIVKEGYVIQVLFKLLLKDNVNKEVY